MAAVILSLSIAANRNRKSWRDTSAETKFSFKSNTPPTMSERNLASTSKIIPTAEFKSNTFQLQQNTVQSKKESNIASIPRSASCPAFKLPETTQPTTLNHTAYNIPKKAQSENSTLKKPLDSPELDLLASCSACPPCAPCGPCYTDCNCGAQLPPPCNTPPKCLQHMTGYYYYPYGTWFCGPYHVGLNCPVPCSCMGGPCCCGLASCSICTNAGFSSTSNSSKIADDKTCGQSTCNVCYPAYSSPRSPSAKGSDFLKASTMTHINSSWGLPGQNGSGYPQKSDTSGAPGTSPSFDKPSKADTTGYFGLSHCSAFYPQTSAASRSWGSSGYSESSYPQTSKASEAKTSPGSRCGVPNRSKCCPQTPMFHKYGSYERPEYIRSGFSKSNQVAGAAGSSSSATVGSIMAKAYSTSSQKSEAGQPVVYPNMSDSSLSSKQDTRFTKQDQIAEKSRSNGHQLPCNCSECASKKVVTFLNKTTTLATSAGTAGDTKLAWRGINSELLSIGQNKQKAKKTEEILEDRSNYCEMLRDPKYTV